MIRCGKDDCRLTQDGMVISDGNDEVIYPLDHKVAGHIVDDEL
jgi:hypothetical protein